MAETIKGINVVIGSDTTGLSAALADVNKSSRDIADELSKVEKLLKFNPKDTTLLAQKQKLLGDQVAVTKEKLDSLKNAQAQVNEQFKKGDITEGQYRAFQREVIETESKLKHYENQLKEVTKTKNELGKKLDELSGKLKNFSDSAGKVGKDLTMKVTAPIVGTGAIAFKMAADMEDALGATEQVFGSAANAVKDWARDLESYYGIAETEAIEYSNMMGSMLQNIGGLTEEQAAKQAQTLIELAGDLTAMYGGTTADAVRALTGALKGNNTMLDNYGMAVNDAMVKTKAYEMGLYDGTGQMDLAAKQAATLALIMEQSGAAQGQAARESEGASGSMRALMTELKNLATTFGQEILPVVTPFITKLKEMVKWFGDLNPTIKQAVLVIAGIAAATGPVVSAIAALASPIGLVVVAIGALIAAGIALWKNWDAVKNAMLNIWDGIVYGIQQAISYLKTLLFSYIKMWIDAINTVGQYIPGLNKALDSAKKTVEGWIETEKDAIEYRREERAETKAQAEALKQVEAELKANQEAANNLAKAEQNLTNAQGQQVQKTKEQLEAEKKLKEDRLKFEADWNQRLLELNEQYSLSRTQNAQEEAAVQLEILERQKNEALVKAQELGANTLAIQKYFALEEQKLRDKQTEAQRVAFEAAGQTWLNFVQTIGDGSKTLKEAIKEMVISIISALQQQIVAQAAAAAAAAYAMALPTFGGSLAHLKVIAAKVLPQIAALEALKAGIRGLAEGAMVTGPTLAVIGERKDRTPEAVLPLTQQVLAGIGKGIAANMPQSASGKEIAVNLNFYAPVIGDKQGMKKLAQEVFSYEYSIKRRLGVQPI
jgi:phage-related minor tail protein